MAIEAIPNRKTLQEAFEHEIYSSDGTPLPLGSLFRHLDDSSASRSILLIFIRHFFCGNCQEYVRRLSSPESPFHVSHQPSSSASSSTTNFSKPVSRSPPAVIVIGPGEPSLISSYSNVTKCPFPIYTDPSTQLYKILGMHRTLALGDKAPIYIQHSLFGGAVKSAWQIVRRVGNGDAMRGGDWDVNGGEFLFVQRGSDQRSQSRKSGSPSRSSNSRAHSSGRHSTSPSSDTSGWEVSWCHRMLNSRDHTEIVDLQYQTFLSGPPFQGDSRSASPPRSILVNGKSSARSVASSSFSTRSYLTECSGSCPGPDIPKSRGEALWNQQLHRSFSKSNLHGRTRSRSSSAHSRIDMKHGRTRSIASRSESRGSNAHPVPAAIEEGDEAKPRKSFTASIVDRVGVLVSTKPLSGKTDTVASVTSAAGSDGAAVPRQTTASPWPLKRSGTAKSIAALLPSRSKSKLKPQGGGRPESALDSRPESPTQRNHHAGASSKSRPKSHSRTRTFSFSKPSVKRGAVEMDESGVMMVDGVEFVNVISVKARIEGGPRLDAGSARKNAQNMMVMSEGAAAIGTDGMLAEGVGAH